MEATLYRAANDTSCPSTSMSFAKRKADAREYLDNPGFGGSTLYRLTISLDDSAVLDLRDGMPKWVRSLWADCNERNAGTFAVFCTTDADFISAARERGFRVVRFVDDYPETCETWAFLFDGCDFWGDDNITPNMTEV